MSIITDLTNKFEPVQLITVYHDRERRFYLESAEIVKGRLGESSPLTEDVLTGIVNYFSDLKKDEDSIKGIIPDCMLYCEWAIESKVLIWYNKPTPRQMYFTDNLKIPSGMANQPTIIYAAVNNCLHVFVAKTSKVNEKTPLFIAPYHNTSLDGSVCLGSSSVRRPAKPTYLNMIEYWEKKFWNSEFSHLADSEDLIKGNVNLFWKDMIKKKLQFDNAVLLPSKFKTFDNALKTLLKNA